MRDAKTSDCSNLTFVRKMIEQTFVQILFFFLDGKNYFIDKKRKNREGDEQSPNNTSKTSKRKKEKGVGP